MLVKDKIVLERQRHGISTSQLGEMVGVNKGTINRYENGVVKQIPTEVLHKITQALECDFDEFVLDDPKYCGLASKKPAKRRQPEFSEEDRMLVAWYHNLSSEVQNVIKQLWTI